VIHDRPQFGLAEGLLDNTVAAARQAEDLGFDYLSTGEHLMFHGAVPNGLISLAAAAGATERIKLFSSITLVPLYPPALLAKQVAMLDIVSNGRFSFGVGVGGEFPKEFDAVGVPVTERGARTNEALEVITRLLTERDVTFDGRFTSLDGVTISPPPVQKPRPPIWVSGRQDAAIRRAARYGDGWMPYLYTPEKLAESMTKVVDMAGEYDRPADAVEGGIYLFTCVNEDRDRALDLANQQLSRQYNQDFSKLVGKYALAGSPEDCIDRLNQYIEAGARTIILAHGCPKDYVDENRVAMAEGILGTFG